MGEIFRATDQELGRDVAVKVLAGRYAQDVQLRERFKREALAAARLSGNPNIVTIFDVDEHNGRPLIVMEYLAGGSLEERARRGASPCAGARLARRRRVCAGRRARGGRRPPRRQAGQPDPRLPRQRPGRRLRNRERVRHGVVHADGHDPRHRRVPVTRAGAGRARRPGQRPLRPRGRRVGAARRTAPVPGRLADCRGGGARDRADPVGARREPHRAGRGRRGLRARAREGSGRALPHGGGVHGRAARRAARRRAATRGSSGRRPRLPRPAPSRRTTGLAQVDPGARRAAARSGHPRGDPARPRRQRQDLGHPARPEDDREDGHEPGHDRAPDRDARPAAATARLRTATTAPAPSSASGRSIERRGLHEAARGRRRRCAAALRAGGCEAHRHGHASPRRTPTTTSRTRATASATAPTS